MEIIVFISVLIVVALIFYGGVRFILNYLKDKNLHKKNHYTKKSLLVYTAQVSFIVVMLITLNTVRNMSNPPKLRENSDPIETIVDVNKRIISIEAYADKVENYLFFQNILIYISMLTMFVFTLITLVYIIINLPIPLDTEEKQNE